MDIKDILGDTNEKPLDRLCTDGGFTGIFRTIACVGDSLSSGEFEAVDPKTGVKIYIDRFDYSWGQYIARQAGCTVYNFSRGGMTAKEYMEHFANVQGFWRRELAANAYIIALGVNDLVNRKQEAGEFDRDVCLEDYTKNAETFIGCYTAIIQRYKTISPDARFFLVTLPRNSDANEERQAIIKKHRELLYEIAGKLSNVYVIDLYEYAPDYNTEFRKSFFLLGHLNPAGYVLTAKMICSYIDHIIRHDLPAFRDVGLMGYDYDRERI